MGDSLRLKYSQSVGPGQQVEVTAQVFSTSTNEQETEKMPDYIQYYMHKESDALRKMVILSLLNQCFSKMILRFLVMLNIE